MKKDWNFTDIQLYFILFLRLRLFQNILQFRIKYNYC